MTRTHGTWRRLAAGMAAALPLTGCITVKAPDKPIEVNLNVDIKQEVLVRLQQDVQQMIQQEPAGLPAGADRSHEAVDCSRLRRWPRRPRRLPRSRRPLGAAIRPARSASATTATWAIAARRRPQLRRQVSAINLRAATSTSSLRRSAGTSPPQVVGMTTGCQLLRAAVAPARPIC